MKMFYSAVVVLLQAQTSAVVAMFYVQDQIVTVILFYGSFGAYFEAGGVRLNCSLLLSTITWLFSCLAEGLNAQLRIRT